MHNHIFQFSDYQRESRITNLEHALNRQRHIPERLNEEMYQKHLHALIGGKIEHPMRGVGRIDILTDDLVIEVKMASHAIRALGQVLCYNYALGGAFLPCLALIGKEKPKINAIASYYGFLMLYSRADTPWYIANKHDLLNLDRSEHVF